MKQPAILIIDNDEGVVNAIVTRLTRRGFECRTASTGAQGLAVFRQAGADLIITDLNMPAGNGVDLLKRIRDWSSVPVIVITGFREDYRRWLRTIPNVTVLEKPFRIVDLINLIDADLLLANRDGQDD